MSFDKPSVKWTKQLKMFKDNFPEFAPVLDIVEEFLIKDLKRIERRISLENSVLVKHPEIAKEIIKLLQEDYAKEENYLLNYK